jgi:membrane protease YdiL (CAAX protease family)
MSNTAHASPGGAGSDNPDLKPLRTFAAIAVPSGWILLGLPVVLHLPVAPFVLATLLIGLVLPTVLLTRRDPEHTMRELLRDCIRLPRGGLLLLPALVALPGTVWAVASATGHAPAIDGGMLVGALVNVASSVLIVNLWEEMAWQGFFQRRATARWGFLRGSLATTTLFVGVHLPLAFTDAEDAADVGYGVAALVASGIGVRLLAGAVDRWSGRSILTVAVLHASFNVAADFVDPNADWIRYAVTVALGLISLLVVTMTARSSARQASPEHPVRGGAR